MSIFKKNSVFLITLAAFSLLASLPGAYAAGSDITEPVSGSVLDSRIVTFVWNNSGAEQYWLWIGTSEGGKDVYSDTQGTNTLKTVSVLPYQGETLYVRLWSMTDGGWVFNSDVVCTACDYRPVTAVIQTPAEGAVLNSADETFAWNNSGADRYWMRIGTFPGTGDVYNDDQGANTSVTVRNLPHSGETLYVRLSSEISGYWVHTERTYTACDYRPMTAVMQTPAEGAVLNSTDETFAWNNSGADQYWLWIGTSQGANDVYSDGRGRDASVTVRNLPHSGETLYVRLSSEISGYWVHTEQTYTACDYTRLKAVMQSPLPGSVLNSETETFVWNSSGASRYWLWIGTSEGGKDLYSDGHATDTSRTVSDLPVSGGTVYVRLFSMINGVWFHNDYTYRENLPVPSVSITADKKVTDTGGSVVLTWNSEGAETCVIGPDIGSVNPNDSVTVTPDATTVYFITASNAGGQAEAGVVVRVVPAITLNITSPLHGNVISGPDIMVRGTVTSTAWDETGVTVNGISAAVSSGEFIVNHVPLAEGENVITAVAADPYGNTYKSSVTVNAGTGGDYIRLTAVAGAGIPPFETILRFDSSFAPVDPTLTGTCPGAEIAAGSDGKYSVSIASEGNCCFTVQASDSQGQSYSHTIAIALTGRREANSVFSTIWNNMTAALKAGDTENALSWFTPGSREDRFRTLLTGISSGDIDEIFSGITGVSANAFHRQNASCWVLRTEEGEKYAYPAEFLKDENGIWKIAGF
ncbi:MAG: hypothetical protein GY795_39805 [Desulfobacterales bacterium]|nr:hypothetical protein [Desulfobacterales bacterium]